MNRFFRFSFSNILRTNDALPQAQGFLVCVMILNKSWPITSVRDFQR